MYYLGIGCRAADLSMHEITTIFICTTVSLMWSPTFPVGYIDILHFHYFNADILLAVLPIPILKTLHINRRRKSRSQAI
ncbi:hypothetical protein BDDG_12874 [Blastomyces dermatitidis ATCC 18188]|uniref:Uncharacterized protein n=1 Tax=Ajellomyces dermatitidis (strain ATCC 18188 / CBS 674.68) TaxID=653446 RepID=A0A0J9ER63_AJEDA|nr:hypothetical protein BDDG_12874 [Blastomyces dermatitidis ATCC 18188]